MQHVSKYLIFIPQMQESTFTAANNKTSFFAFEGEILNFSKHATFISFFMV